MKNLSILLLAVVFVFSLISCDKDFITPSIQTSKEITTVSKEGTNFTTLQVANEFEVFLTFSDTENKIQVEANENLQEYIIVEQTGNTLDIRMKKNINIKGNQTTKVYITTKEITNFKAAGEVNIQLNNELVTDNVRIDLAGDTQLEGKVAANTVTANLAGEAQLNLSGQASNFDISMAGESKIRDYAFSCKKIEASLAGESELFLTVTESLFINAVGESILHYKGTGTIEKKQLVGEAKIRKED